MRHHKFYRTILNLAVLVVVLSIFSWARAPQVARAIPPAQDDPPAVTIQLAGPTSVTEGDTFAVDVVAGDIPDPGLFGYQIAVSWAGDVFTLLGVATNPDFPLLARQELGDSTVEIAASRQGDVTDVTGPITLLTLEFQADVVTEPDPASFIVTDVKLGRKGGIDVPVGLVAGLEVVVTPRVPDGDISGNVKVEGRAGDNQAGHSVTDDGSLSATTDTVGDFLLADVEFGTYNLTANSPGFLAATCAGLVHDSDPAVLNGVVLLAGDIDDDGIIGITDAVAIGLTFGSAGGAADLNADGVVDVLDLIIMAVNFDQTSAGNPWVCQP